MNRVCSYCNCKNCMINIIYQKFREEDQTASLIFVMNEINNTYKNELYEEIEEDPKHFLHLFIEFNFLDHYSIKQVLETPPNTLYNYIINDYFLNLSNLNLKDFHFYHTSYDLYGKLIKIYKNKTKIFNDIYNIKILETLDNEI